MKFFINIFSWALLSVLVSSGRIGSRIIGGQLARAGEFPFSVAVNIFTADGVYFCGGALVSHQYVLTAAQCIDGATRFTITLGADNLQTSTSKVTVAADEYIVHPTYDAFTLQHDIGLIKLRMPIEYSDYIRPILLPIDALQDYTTVVAIGWGQISDEDPGTVTDLNRVTITSLSNAECRLTYGSAIIDDMVCAEGNYNQGSCNGDSGSPLVQYALNQQATAVGVASFFSGNGCESTDPSGYTRVFPYVSWIYNITSV